MLRQSNVTFVQSANNLFHAGSIKCWLVITIFCLFWGTAAPKAVQNINNLLDCKGSCQNLDIKQNNYYSTTWEDYKDACHYNGHVRLRVSGD